MQCNMESIRCWNCCMGISLSKATHKSCVYRVWQQENYRDLQQPPCPSYMLEEISTLVPGTTFLPLMQDLEIKKFHHHQKTRWAGWGGGADKWLATRFVVWPVSLVILPNSNRTHFTPLQSRHHQLAQHSALRAGSIVSFTWISPSAWKNVTSEQTAWHQSSNVQGWCFFGQ